MSLFVNLSFSPAVQVNSFFASYSVPMSSSGAHHDLPRWRAALYRRKPRSPGPHTRPAHHNPWRGQGGTSTRWQRAAGDTAGCVPHRKAGPFHVLGVCQGPPCHGRQTRLHPGPLPSPRESERDTESESERERERERESLLGTILVLIFVDCIICWQAAWRGRRARKQSATAMAILAAAKERKSSKKKQDFQGS